GHGLPGSRRAGASHDQAVPLGERQGGTQDGPPANRGSAVLGLLEDQRMAGQGGSSEEDLGDRQGGRVALLDEPRRDRPDEDPAGRNPLAPGEGRPEKLEGEGAA